MDATVVAAMMSGGLALAGSSAGLIYQARGQRLARRISEASAVTEARSESNEAVFEAWKRIVDAQDRRIERLEKSEGRCHEELQEVRLELKRAIHGNRP